MMETDDDRATGASRAILSQIVTQVTLIDRMAGDGGSNADWARFFAIYYPAAPVSPASVGYWKRDAPG